VLEPLAGYLMMAQAMATRPGFATETLNFAPDPQQAKTVAELVEAYTAAFGGRPGWVQEPGDHLHEARLLALSADNAQAVLGWRPRLEFNEAVAWTADWYDAHRTKAEVRDVSLEQIAAYDALLQHDEASRQSLVEKAHSRP
jgi:CDP-glucose 4,6-dehydratase